MNKHLVDTHLISACFSLHTVQRTIKITMLEYFKTGFHTVCHHYFLNLCLKWEFQIFYTCISLPSNTMTVKDSFVFTCLSDLVSISYWKCIFVIMYYYERTWRREPQYFKCPVDGDIKPEHFLKHIKSDEEPWRLFLFL